MSKVYADLPGTPRFMTLSDLRDLGKDEVGYVRRHLLEGQAAFVLHAADGTALAVQRDIASARLSARVQSLELVSVH
jgi:hypothetical protein